MSDRCQCNDHLSNSQHDFKGWGENQRVMLHDKTRFFSMTATPAVEIWFPRAWSVMLLNQLRGLSMDSYIRSIT